MAATTETLYKPTRFAGATGHHSNARIQNPVGGTFIGAPHRALTKKHHPQEVKTFPVSLSSTVVGFTPRSFILPGYAISIVNLFNPQHGFTASTFVGRQVRVVGLKLNLQFFNRQAIPTDTSAVNSNVFYRIIIWSYKSPLISTDLTEVYVNDPLLPYSPSGPPDPLTDPIRRSVNPTVAPVLLSALPNIVIHYDRQIELATTTQWNQCVDLASSPVGIDIPLDFVSTFTTSGATTVCSANSLHMLIATSCAQATTTPATPNFDFATALPALMGMTSVFYTDS